MTPVRDKRTSLMTKRARGLLCAFVLLLVVIQFFGPARTNPPVVESRTLRSQLNPPSQVADILSRACMDCHSYETRWPWYGRVAPVRWWLVDHVNTGRKELNFSEWTQYPPWFASATLGAMATAVQRDAMPLASYRALHPDAQLSVEETKAFSDWAQAEKRRIQNLFLKSGQDTK